MFKKIHTLIVQSCKKLNEKGQGMVEYALILAAVAIIAIFAIWGTNNEGKNLKESVGNAFTTAADKIDAAQNQGNANSTPSTTTEGSTE